MGNISGQIKTKESIVFKPHYIVQILKEVSIVLTLSNEKYSGTMTIKMSKFLPQIVKWKNKIGNNEQ